MILIKLDLSLRKSSGNQGLCIEHIARVVILGVSDLTVGLWAKSGKLRPIGIGGLTILLPKAQLIILRSVLVWLPTVAIVV